MSDPESCSGGNLPRRRPASEAYIYKMEALRIVEPINERLSAWSPRAVYLMARAQHTRLTSTIRTEILAEAQTLLVEARRMRTELDARIKDLPPEIATHSRVADAKRALQSIESSLAQTLMLLDAGEPRG